MEQATNNGGGVDPATTEWIRPPADVGGVDQPRASRSGSWDTSGVHGDGIDGGGSRRRTRRRIQAPGSVCFFFNL